MQDNNSSEQQKTQGAAVNTTAAKIAQQKVQGKVASAVGKRFAQTKLASSVAGKAIGKAVGAITGGPVGTAIAVASMVNIKKLPEYAAGAVVGLGSAVGGLAGAAGAVIGAAVAGVGITIGIAIITIPILVGLIMFIINSGAYIVPPISGLNPDAPGGGGGGISIDVPCDTNAVPGNPAMAAICIVDALIQYKLNPLNRTMLNSANWNAFTATLPAAVVDRPIYAVTFNNYYFQCTGLPAAASIYSGTPFLLSQPRACLYLFNPPAGYRAVRGTDGIAAGDFFIINGTPTCGAGAGHIGVVLSVDGALISCAEANYHLNGDVRVAHGCWDLTSIAGYLRKI